GDEGLQVLLIGKEGSHGLDLSLATHVFLMDQIWDENLQNQVVSRAYRMGAQASVHVERLVMQDTVEEAMETLATGRLGGPQFEINTQGDDSD
ncbi:ring finger-like protein, partial [Nannochloropsis gaditana CCMP526]